ncbi:hypothetical protein WJ968_15035 [Achromobacter xylosoxidans]
MHRRQRGQVRCRRTLAVSASCGVPRRVFSRTCASRSASRSSSAICVSSAI